MLKYWTTSFWHGIFDMLVYVCCVTCTVGCSCCGCCGCDTRLAAMVWPVFWELIDWRDTEIFSTQINKTQTHSIHIHNKYIMQNVSVLKGFLKLQFLQFLWDWSFLFFMLTYMHAHTHPHTQTWLLMDDRRWEVFSIAEADWRGGVLCSACSFVWVATHTNKTLF